MLAGLEQEAMSALLSCPDGPLLSHIVGKLTFVQHVNQRQLTMV